MVVVSHLFLFYGKISGADVTWYESHLPLFGTIYFPIAPFSECLSYGENEEGSFCMFRFLFCGTIVPAKQRSTGHVKDLYTRRTE